MTKRERAKKMRSLRAIMASMSDGSLELAIKCTRQEGEPGEAMTFYRLAEMYNEKARRLERGNYAGREERGVVGTRGG